MNCQDKVKYYTPLIAAFAAFGGVVFLSGSGSLCLFRTFTGLPCPGCGLTTAGLALLRGDWALAWQASPFIYLLPVACGVILHDLYCRKVHKKKCRFHQFFYVVVVAALSGFFIYRLLKYFPEGPYPMVWHRRNVVCKLLELLNLRWILPL